MCQRLLVSYSVTRHCIGALDCMEWVSQRQFALGGRQVGVERLYDLRIPFSEIWTEEPSPCSRVRVQPLPVHSCLGSRRLHAMPNRRDLAELHHPWLHPQRCGDVQIRLVIRFRHLLQIFSSESFLSSRVITEPILLLLTFRNHSLSFVQYSTMWNVPGSSGFRHTLKRAHSGSATHFRTTSSNSGRTVGRDSGAK